jgi:uncharacterized ferredoxin-like protein
MGSRKGDGRTVESEAVFEVAKLMLVSARTAPKSGGVDDILTMVVSGERKDAIAKEMEMIGDDRRAEGKFEGFSRDADNVRRSVAIVLIGVRGTKSFGLDCGACGYDTCKDFCAAGPKMGKDFVGPTCLFKALDLGIALGSAVKMASVLNVDNRIMYRVGTAALRLRMLPEGTVIMGIPVSAEGKSIFFDRK